MDLNMHHRPEYAAWTRTCNIDMNMQHGHDINNIDTDLKYGMYGTCSMTGIRSMDLDKQLWHSFVLFSLAILEISAE
jgi:hypothetical protein